MKIQNVNIVTPVRVGVASAVTARDLQRRFQGRDFEGHHRQGRGRARGAQPCRRGRGTDRARPAARWLSAARATPPPYCPRAAARPSTDGNAQPITFDLSRTGRREPARDRRTDHRGLQEVRSDRGAFAERDVRVAVRVALGERRRRTRRRGRPRRGGVTQRAESVGLNGRAAHASWIRRAYEADA